MSAAVAGGSPEARRRRSRGYHPDRSAASPEVDSAVRLKVESDVDIKDYAETTMNELLGWYGYDKLDTRGLNLKHLHLPPTSSSSSSPLREDFSEEDTPSNSPHFETPDSSAQTLNGGTIVCAWCLKTGLKLFTLKTSSGKTKAFCSEPCFNQCRRAAFKKNRVCNWCRHVRHTVNYVDFKDGDDQLQFCSDKCLNQYKMQIFCKETQAYLQMNPHLQEESSKQAGTATSKLITPDLWLRDCQEPVNGETPANLLQSDDDQASPLARTSAASRTCDDECVEDLTISSKPESRSPTNVFTPAHDKLPEPHRSNMVDNLSSSKRKPPFEMGNALSSYLRDDRDYSILDRKKRYYENDRDHFRKRQKILSSRSRSSHPAEAPPAHLSSSHSPLTMPSRLLHNSGSPYPPPRNTNSSPLNPPAAHTKSLPPHPSMAGSLVPPSLPPPPPLLNNEFLHHTPLSSSFFPPTFSTQQHMDAVLRMQAGIRPGEHFPPHLFQDPMLPHTRTPHSTSFMQPNTVMLPYPVFVPLPVPIPIPIPLLSKEKNLSKDIHKQSDGDNVSDESGGILNVDSDSDSCKKASKNSKSDSNDSSSINTHKRDNQTPTVDVSTYAVKNNDSNTNRLILTRNKTR